jgi:hypothetical protein
LASGRSSWCQHVVQESEGTGTQTLATQLSRSLAGSEHIDHYTIHALKLYPISYYIPIKLTYMSVNVKEAKRKKKKS